MKPIVIKIDRDTLTVLLIEARHSLLNDSACYCHRSSTDSPCWICQLHTATKEASHLCGSELPIPDLVKQKEGAE